MFSFILLLGLATCAICAPVPTVKGNPGVYGHDHEFDAYLLMIKCRHALVWYNLSEPGIPHACELYASRFKPAFSDLLKPELIVPVTDGDGISKFVPDILSLEAEEVSAWYSRLHGYWTARKRSKTLQEREELDRKYHPTSQ